ncbi:MAG: hypothetical protein IPF77_09025 [Gemmatimonadetes bacterium]|nr:hypothetical protein [Gemmatimonadota bacterium]
MSDYALMDGARTGAVVTGRATPTSAELVQLRGCITSWPTWRGWSRRRWSSRRSTATLLSPKRLGAAFPGAAGPAAGGLSTLHPRLPIIFAGSRKLANLWTYRYFQAVARARQAPAVALELDLSQRFHDPPAARGARA